MAKINYWTASTVSVSRPIYRRLMMLTEEIITLNELDPGTKSIRDLTDEFANRILHEYVRQHFEESTKIAAQNFDVQELSFLP